MEQENWTPPLPVPNEEISAPARVETAFEVVRWANFLEMGNMNYRSTETSPSRSLNSREKSVYESALEVLRLYLTGEMSFQNEPVQSQENSKITVGSENVKTTS